MSLDSLLSSPHQKHSYSIGSSFLRADPANDYGESCGFYCSSNVKKQKKRIKSFFCFFNIVKLINIDAVAD